MQMIRMTAVSVLLWAILFAPLASAASIEKEREWFLQARQALNQDKLETYEQLRARLKTYPLTPYLDIWHASRQMKQGDDSAVAARLLQYKDVPEAADLHISWMRDLAKRGQWPQVAKHLNDFPGTSSRLPQLAMVSRWRTGEKTKALEEFSKRWQQGKTIADYTQPMYQAWKKLGHPTAVERWQRIATYARRGKWRKVKALARPLPKQDKSRVKYWQSMQNNPAKALKHWPKGMSSWLARRIFSDGLKRISRSDALAAWKVLQTMDKTISADIGEHAVARMKRNIALRAARQHQLIAASWLEKLPGKFRNEDTRAWQARLYVLFHDWGKVLVATATMPLAEQRQSSWIYWRARALELSGNKQAAQPLFAELARGRGYYSFLSAEHLKLPLIFNMSEIEVSDSSSRDVSRKPAIRRAYEWLQLGKMGKARREWALFFAAATPERWKVAAHLAESWGWHDRTIQAASRAGENNALSSRFPMGFELQVRRAAQKTDLEPAYIWSIIRQESAFNQQAVSRSGARGLMQLMPATARGIIKKHKLKKGDMFSPKVNIRLGTLYLAEMTKRFGNNPALAAAAYNAGPHRVNTWLKRTPFESAEAWIEAIPFNETRRYVQQIMAFVSVYEWRQAKIPGNLTARINKPPAGVNLSLNP